MSHGPGNIERRIGELFAATKARALSIGEIAAHAFALADGMAPDRKQRLSATRAAHRLLQRAAAATEAYGTALERVIAETAAIIGRPPGGRGRGRVYFLVGAHVVAVDEAFRRAMEAAPSWTAWQQAWPAMRKETNRFDGVLVGLCGGWRATETADRRLWFHPADYPVRVWAVAIEPEGVVWADAEITGIDNTYVRIRYRGEPGRLRREKLARSWTLYRNVYFTSSRSGYAARAFDQMWQEKYRRPGSAPPPPVVQMPLAEAIRLLGVPADFTREEIIAAFRRKAMKCHPDHGGTAEQFRKLVEARARLLASIGAKAKAPKMPEFAPAGIKLHYGAWRPSSRFDRIGQTRRLTR